MAEKSIVTQTQLGDLKSALAQEADSLVFHSSQSLSKSHGFGVIFNGPADDGNGNDLTYYQDSAGNRIGDAMLLLIVNQVKYYVPFSYTALSGQNSTSAIIPNLSPLLQPGENAWITDYTTESTADAQLVMSALLLPHTRLGSFEVHSTLNAYPQTTYDSAGHIVGDSVIELFFNQKKIWIPCSTRLGGPIQPPRFNGGYTSSFVEGSGMHGIDPPNPDTVYLTAQPSGTKPFTFFLDYWYNNMWNACLPTYPPNTQVSPPSYIHNHGNIPIQYSSSNGSIKIFNMPEGDNNESYSLFRLSCQSQSGGPVVYDGTLTVKMREIDPGMCFFFKTATDFTLPDYVCYDLKDEFYTVQLRRGYKWMTHWGVPLMNRSKLFFAAIKYGIVKPFIHWCGYRYRKNNRSGWLMTPVCRFWLAAWNALGKVVSREYDKPPGWHEKELKIIRSKLESD